MTDKERISQIEEVVSEILVKQDRISEEIAHLSVKVAANSIDINRLKVVVTSLETKVDRLEAKVDKLEAKVDKLEAKVDRLEMKVNTHTEMIVALQHDMRAGQAELKQGIEMILQAVRGK